MQPFKRKINGQEQKIYSVRFSLNGKQKVLSTGKSNKADAEKWIKDNINPIVNQTNIKGLAEHVKLMTVDLKLPLENVFEEFLSINNNCGEKLNNQKRRTWNHFTEYVKKSDPSIKYIHQLNSTLCKKYLTFLKQSGQSGQGTISNRTSNTYYNQLKTICETLLDNSELITNPFDSIKRKSSDTEHKEAYTPDELKLIGETNRDPFLIYIFTVGMYTGLRKIDLCTLKWSEIDLQNKWINRNMSKTKLKVRIPIQPVFHQYLKTLTYNKNDYVNTELTLQYFKRPDTITDRIKAFLENDLGIKTTKKVPGRNREVSIKDIHSLRHTYVWLGADSGTPISTMQSAVGHMTEEMTRIYMDHATDESKQSQLHIPNYLNLPDDQSNIKDSIVKIQEILISAKDNREKLRLIQNASKEF